MHKVRAVLDVKQRSAAGPTVGQCPSGAEKEACVGHDHIVIAWAQRNTGRSPESRPPKAWAGEVRNQVERWMAHNTIARCALFERKPLGRETRGQHRDRLDQPEADQLVVEIAHIALQTPDVWGEMGAEDEQSHRETIACLDLADTSRRNVRRREQAVRACAYGTSCGSDIAEISQIDRRCEARRVRLVDLYLHRLLAIAVDRPEVEVRSRDEPGWRAVPTVFPRRQA